MYRRTICLSVLLTAGMGLLTAGPSMGASLPDEVSRLLADHPQLERAAAALQRAKYGEDEALSRFLPRVSVSGDAGYEHTNSPATRAAGGDLSTSRYSGRVAAELNLFDGFGSTANRDEARYGTRIAEQEARRVRQQVLLEAARSYLDVMRQSDLLRLSRSNEEAIKRQLDLEDERVRRGSGIAVDVLLAKSRLQVSKERRTLVETRLSDAESRYEQVFGAFPETGSLEAPVLPRAALPESYEAAVGELSSTHPAVLGSQRRIDQANQARRGARSGYYPRLDLVAQNNWEDDVDGVDGTRRDYALMARVKWELFSGFETKARVAEAAAAYSEAVQEARQVERESREGLETAWHQMSSTGERVALLANAVTIAAEVYDARKKLRDAGKETSLNVLDAENELLNACINFVNADFENRVSVYQVLSAMGRLEAETLTDPGAGSGTSLAQQLPDSARACGITGPGR